MEIMYIITVVLILAVAGYFVVKAVRAYDYKKDYTLEAQRLAPIAKEVLGSLDELFLPNHKVSTWDIHNFLDSNKKTIRSVEKLYGAEKHFHNILARYGLLHFRERLKPQVLDARKKENNQAYDTIQLLKERTYNAFAIHQSLTAPSHYFSHSDMEFILPLIEELKVLVDRLKPKYASFVDNRADYLIALLGTIEQKRKVHNDKFERRELTVNKDYFDSVLGKYPLDAQQRETIVKLEDNCLVISSAGSGKTSTSIAKVKYLLDKRGMKAEEILVMSFNNKTAAEFREKLDIPTVTCETFHAEALHIVAEVGGHKPSISDPKDHLLTQCHYMLERGDANYKKAITDFVTDISSMMKREHEYAYAKDYYEDRAKYGIVSPYLDMDCKPIYTKSEEEKRICIWLSEHGVRFRYEEPYPIPTHDGQHRQYKPDFSIHFKAGNVDRVVYLEHFGIDANGNVPQWFGDGNGGFRHANAMYRAGINWKRSTHQTNHTILLETRSSMFQDGTIYMQLENQLKAEGVPMRTLNDDERHALIFKRDKTMEDNLMNLLSSIISLMKSNGKTYDDVMDMIRANEGAEFQKRSEYLLYQVVKPLRDKYEQELRKRGERDFTDIIRLATDYCNTGRWHSPFKYIIVDEFQDISTSRYEFIQSLRQKSPLTKTFLVGDDWQSIYRFAGSDLNLFQYVEKYFGYTERCKIETTYRFGNPLVGVSSDFILKNPFQSRKAVRPFSEDKFTDLEFVSFDRNEDNDNYQKLVSIVQKIPANESILLLARYEKDIEVVPREYRTYARNSKYPEVTICNRKMKFLTVHAAKGLEEDNVILLNCSQDGGGFPSRIADDPILSYLLSTPDNFDYSEERRLFYVAITRAKRYVYVMYNQNMPSFFVTELMPGNETENFVCPLCKKGLLTMMREEQAANGKMYRNYRCSNSVAGCNFFWRVFFDDWTQVAIQYHKEMDQYF